jgi:hypothetical protein
VRDRCAEQSQRAVAGELRHRTPEPLDLLAHHPDELVEEELRPLRPEPLRDRGRVGHVDDEHRHDPLLTRSLCHRSVIRRR